MHLTNTYTNLADIQSEFTAAVIMPTLLRDCIFKALESVFKQENLSRIQILIGVDVPSSDNMVKLHAFLEDLPHHVAVTVLNPGYSTSQRHGGMHKAFDGGALRTILSFLANSRYIAYLDDDNWWEPNHLSSLLNVIEDHAWAFSHRNYVHDQSGALLCRDSFESVGPGKGIFSQKAGGFVDPNCLMINKTKADSVLQLWSTHADGDLTRMSGDRLIFNQLRQVSYGNTNSVTVNYAIDPKDSLHPYRLRFMPEDIRKLHYGEED